MTKSEPRNVATYASLRFSGDRLEPDRITALIGIAPRVAYRKGEVFKRSRGQEIRGRTGLWLVSSEDRVESDDLNDHLDYLLSLVSPQRGQDRLAKLQSLLRKDGLEADIPCFWHGSHGARPPSIREDVRERLAQIPARLDEDFDTD